MSLETDRIEADLDASRHRLNDTLEALGNKLSPGQMLDEVLGLARGQAGEFAGKLGRQVKDNPMPTVLIAAGIAWLMLNNRQGHHNGLSADDWHSDRQYRSLEEARWMTQRLPDETDDAYDQRMHLAYAEKLDLKQKAGEAAHEFKARVAKTVDGIRTTAEGARRRMANLLSDAKHAAGQQLEGIGEKAAAARHRAEDFYTETPLTAGAIALAAGALIGSATPLSRPERDALSGVADKAARTGADLAERGAQKVEDAIRPLH